MRLTSRQALAILSSAEERARELGLPVVIAVIDEGGHTKLFHRMDGAVLASVDIAVRKAKTALAFQCNSEEVWEYCKPGGSSPGLELTNGGLAPYGGGISLKGSDGACIGALGISGGSIAQDSTIARSAFAAFNSMRSEPGTNTL